MNLDSRYTLPFELGADRALNIYRQRFIRILVWGASGTISLVLVLLLAAIFGSGIVPIFPLIIIALMACSVFFLVSCPLISNSKKSKLSSPFAIRTNKQPNKHKKLGSLGISWIIFILASIATLSLGVSVYSLFLMPWLLFFLMSEAAEPESSKPKKSENHQKENEQLGREIR